jgi:pimeloyl-ACP methyl ester carboxylesterase
MSWNSNPLLPGRLRQAVKRAKAPVFLLQAENDFSLGPSQALSKEADKQHKDFRSKVYPAFGTTNHDGHWGFCTTATEVWGSDVLGFLEEQMRGAK